MYTLSQIVYLFAGNLPMILAKNLGDKYPLPLSFAVPPIFWQLFANKLF